MQKLEYKQIESYMLASMNDVSHDRHHVYRVLNCAVDISRHMDNVDIDVLFAACLLHDIGRDAQFKNPTLCHAKIGGEMAYNFLLSKGWAEDKAMHVKECITSHRFRKGSAAPKSIEAKILFDADKLDVCGAIGIARTLFYGGQMGEPLYNLDDNNNIITDGGGEDVSSFFQEYHYKLKKLSVSFYTKRGKELAIKRQQAAVDFYNNLYNEITENYTHGLLW